MSRRFTARDRERLCQAMAEVESPRRLRRLQAVLWVAEGHSVTEAARLAHGSRRSVQSWCRLYFEQRCSSPSALLTEKPRPGRPRSAAGQISQKALKAVLGQNPLSLGYQSTGWTLPLLATHLQRLLGGARPSASTLRRRLHEAGWRWKRPRYAFKAPDPQGAQKKGGFA